ncbi:hypothetical protein RYX36_011564 [Vicia faba]
MPYTLSSGPSIPYSVDVHMQYMVLSGSCMPHSSPMHYEDISAHGDTISHGDTCALENSRKERILRNPPQEAMWIANEWTRRLEQFIASKDSRGGYRGVNEYEGVVEEEEKEEENN